jgi:hypothetical protein
VEGAFTDDILQSAQKGDLQTNPIPFPNPTSFITWSPSGSSTITTYHLLFNHYQNLERCAINKCTLALTDEVQRADLGLQFA